MSIFDAAFLGLLQGLSEFLPVSSSGHLILGSAVLGLKAPGLSFSIMVHLGTALATVAMLYPEIAYLVRGILSPKDSSHRKRALTVAGCIVLASVPGFLVGVIGGDSIDRVFQAPIVASFGLIGTSVVLFLGRSRTKRRAAGAQEIDGTRPRPDSGPRMRHRRSGETYDPSVLSTIDYGRAVIVGLAQAVAITPGLSRSGTTLTAGLISGMSREDSARFSFLLALPAVVGAALLDFMEISGTGGPMFTKEALLGAAVAFVSGMFALSSVVRTVRKGELSKYAWYCLAVGLASLIWFVVNGQNV